MKKIVGLYAILAFLFMTSCKTNETKCWLRSYTIDGITIEDYYWGTEAGVKESFVPESVTDFKYNIAPKSESDCTSANKCWEISYIKDGTLFESVIFGTEIEAKAQAMLNVGSTYKAINESLCSNTKKCWKITSIPTTGPIYEFLIWDTELAAKNSASQLENGKYEETSYAESDCSTPDVETCWKITYTVDGTVHEAMVFGTEAYAKSEAEQRNGTYRECE